MYSEKIDEYITLTLIHIAIINQYVSYMPQFESNSLSIE